MIILCSSCSNSIYRLKKLPIPGSVMESDDFESLKPYEYPHPEVGMPIICPCCGEFPFIAHNTGIQVQTIEGEILPCLT